MWLFEEVYYNIQLLGYMCCISTKLRGCFIIHSCTTLEEKSRGLSSIADLLVPMAVSTRDGIEPSLYGFGFVRVLVKFINVRF